MIEKLADGTEQQYEIYKLVDQYDRVLITPTPVFDFANPPVDPRYLVYSMIKTMIVHGGVGLAAPQCGLSHRLFVMGAQNGQGFACFNPKITKFDGETAFEEGCLSFKGLYLNIKRPETIEVEYQDMTGAVRTGIFNGLTSRTYQHELDHLEGVVYTGLVNRYTLDKAKTKVKTNLKKLAKQRENYERQQIINLAAQRVMEANRVAELNKQINVEIPNISIDMPQPLVMDVPKSE